MLHCLARTMLLSRFVPTRKKVSRARRSYAKLWVRAYGRKNRTHCIQVQSEASGKFKEISIRHGFVSGKWSYFCYCQFMAPTDASPDRLIFAPTDKVDLIWSTIASEPSSDHHGCSMHIYVPASLVSGPLASTSAYSAKVATCPQNETPNYSHVLCLYMPDVYDQDSVTEARSSEYLTGQDI